MLGLSAPIVLAAQSTQSGGVFALLWPIPFAAMAVVGAFVASPR
jgi:hypothetical protein